MLRHYMFPVYWFRSIFRYIRFAGRVGGMVIIGWRIAGLIRFFIL
jgi:hypothetical protein